MKNLKWEAVAQAMETAGKMMLTAHDVETEKGAVQEKGNANFVTKYDKAVQGQLVEHLHRILPEADFLAEEEDLSKTKPTDGYCFVIDPIDGTTNFMRDYHCSGISVGLLLDGKPVFGVIYLPYTAEVFHAEKGQGAFLGNRPIHVSNRPFSQAVCTFGTSIYYREELAMPTMHLAADLLKNTADLRRSGSCAFDFCMLAGGRTDAFFEYRLSPWDYAAGTVLVSEAGGIISNAEGTDLRFDRPDSVCCGNRLCYPELFQKMKACYPGH